MALSGKLNKTGIQHSNVESPTHKHDKEFFKSLHSRRAKLVLEFPTETPMPNAARRTFDGEQHFPIVFDNQGKAVKVSGKTYEQHLEGARRLRLKKRVSKGTYTLKSGVKKPRKPVKVDNAAPLIRETVPLPPWMSELVSIHASELDLLHFGEFLRHKLEDLTGDKAQAVNFHYDTPIIHPDIVRAPRSPFGEFYSTHRTGAWRISDGRSIVLRYHRMGFPVDPELLKTVTKFLEKDRGRSGFSCHWNLELGYAADEWVSSWAVQRGLGEELEHRRKRFQLHQEKVIEAKTKMRQFLKGQAVILPNTQFETMNRKQEKDAERIRDLEAQLGAANQQAAKAKDALARLTQARLSASQSGKDLTR